MTETQRIAELTALFERLGARDPAAWARSEVEEGIPQLARFLFLRQGWRQVVSEDDTSWIDKWIASWKDKPNAPYAAIGRALSTLLEKGATRAELADLVRGMQALVLFELCYLLDDPQIEETEVRDVAWRLRI